MRKIDLTPYDSKAFVAKYGPWAVIAGASDGTGACFAERLAAIGMNVVLVARRGEILEQIGSDLAKKYGIQYRALVVDLKTQDAARKMLDGTADLDVGLYISNAGTDGSGNSFLEAPVERALGVLTMNCWTLIGAVHGFGNRMLKRGRGGVIIMGSSSGLGGQPWLTMYSSTKAFGINMSECLWAELTDQNIDVLGSLAPGMDTPSLRKAVEGKGYDLVELCDPADVAHNSLAALGKQSLLIFPDGPDIARTAEIQADRHRRLLAMSEWAKAYTT